MGAPGSASPSPGYFDRSKQPLETLALLSPLVIAYEAGLLGALRHGDWVITNRAHSSLLSFFQWVGIRGDHLLVPAMSLPALAVVAVLLLWQFFSRRPWSLHLPTVAGMAVESILSALPLVVVGWLLAPLIDLLAAAGDEGTLVRGLPMAGQIAMAIGAGIYEEFLFRLVLVSLLHSILKRVPGFTDRRAVIAAVLLSAAAFSLHHPVLHDGHLQVREALFLFIAGTWWGALFVVRGLGIAAGSHAAYDALVITLPLLTSRSD